MKTTNPQQAAHIVIDLINDEATHGTFDGAGSIDRFAMIHEYMDANELLEWAVPGDRVNDSALINSVTAAVDAILAETPFTF